MATIASERWLPVPGWEERYEVSDYGNVRSLWNKWGRRPQPVLLKQKTNGRSMRACVVLYSGSPRTPRTRLVHHLVLEAFAGPRPPGQEARHGPGGMHDNRLSNLRWGTHSENVGADKVRDGTSNRGERSSHAKLTAAQVTEIRRRGTAGELHRVLASEFGVNPSTITRIINGKRWPH